MNETRLVLDMLYSLLMAGLYGAVAWAVGRRHVTTAAENANRSFVTWWGGLAIISVAGAVANLLGHMGAWTLPGFLTYTQLNLIAIVVILMALMYYFVYLFTGSSKATSAVVAFYLAFLGFILYYINLGQPIGLIDGPNGGVTIEYADDLSETALARWLGILLLLPLVLGALAYTSLFFKVKDRTQRFRIVTVGGSIFVWMLTALGASLGGLDPNEQLWWLITSRVIAITATVANLVAFLPPKWVQRKLGVRPVVASKESAPPS